MYTRGAATEKQELVWVTRDGKAQPVDPDWQGTFREPSIARWQSASPIALLPDASYEIIVKQMTSG